MSHFDTSLSTCPRCQSTLSAYSSMQNSTICDHCGYTSTADQESEDSNSQKKYLMTLVIIGVFVIFSFMHVINWDRHSFTIIPLKAKYLLGVASNSDLRNMANICTDRMKYSCSEAALTDLVEQSKKAEDALALGNLRRRMSMYNESLLAYEDALTKPEKSPVVIADIHFGLARSYEALGDKDKAFTNYELAIAAKPDVTQITVLESYVQLLIKSGEINKAERVVKEARKRSGSDRLLAQALGG